MAACEPNHTALLTATTALHPVAASQPWETPCGKGVEWAKDLLASAPVM